MQEGHLLCIRCFAGISILGSCLLNKLVWTHLRLPNRTLGLLSCSKLALLREGFCFSLLCWVLVCLLVMVYSHLQFQVCEFLFLVSLKCGFTWVNLWICLPSQSCPQWMELERLFLLLAKVSFQSQLQAFYTLRVVLFLLPCRYLSRFWHMATFTKYLQIINCFSCSYFVEMLSRVPSWTLTVRTLFNVMINFCLGNCNKRENLTMHYPRTNAGE